MVQLRYFASLREKLGIGDETVMLPDWIGDEVTHDPRYFNANLIAHPYSAW